MKFRAIMTDKVHIRELLNIVTTLSRINRNIIINVQPSKLVLQIETDAETGQCLWGEIDAAEREGFFSEYVMDGIDDQYNQIYLTVGATNLVRALSWHHSIDYLKLKLEKTDMVYLAVELTGVLHNVEVFMCPKVNHQIPVTVVPRSEWKHFNLPQTVKYDLTTTLPSLKSLRALMEKKKHLSPAVTVYATDAGELSLVVETDIVTVGSHYKGLQSSWCAGHPPSGNGDSSPPLTDAACRVDSKKLSTILESINCCDLKMVANIKHERLLNIRFEIKHNVFMSFILPAVGFD
ncbi:checkpoint protein HUS1 [Sabethes cyaneus]|uniref:checkpoint protein HUS1 n=1 Tax=Sabethes cyaneus TaxID=53552 RepID=UPI00237EB9F5|nr:checkpoint protein HUS1 [Sabethes cyaneus]